MKLVLFPARYAALMFTLCFTMCSRPRKFNDVPFIFDIFYIYTFKKEKKMFFDFHQKEKLFHQDKRIKNNIFHSYINIRAFSSISSCGYFIYITKIKECFQLHTSRGWDKLLTRLMLRIGRFEIDQERAINPCVRSCHRLEFDIPEKWSIYLSNEIFGRT